MKINRRKLLSLLGVYTGVLAGPSALADQKKSPAKPSEAKIEALNPKGMAPSIQLIPMEPRRIRSMAKRASASVDNWRGVAYSPGLSPGRSTSSIFAPAGPAT
jgi:hypothetical protein